MSIEEVLEKYRYSLDGNETVFDNQEDFETNLFEDERDIDDR